MLVYRHISFPGAEQVMNAYSLALFGHLLHYYYRACELSAQFMLYAFGGTNTYRSFIRHGGARLP